VCGIAGIWHYSGGVIDPARIAEAAAIMRHRGPDDEGLWFTHSSTGAHALRKGDDTVSPIPGGHWNDAGDPLPFAPDLALAHRRLSIIDLSPGGHEPLTTPDGDLWLTFNGEIYNYQTLRTELIALGRRFHTQGDGEVILHAYAEWGTDCLHRFVGMFAFALYDRQWRRLWLARDHFGVKPLYYADDGARLAFASEIKALRPLVPSALIPDMSALALFLTDGVVYDAPNTFFQGVRELPGGHHLTVENGRVGAPVCWWDFDLARARAVYDYTQPEHEFLRLLDDSVRLQLVGDVPVGTCLSGGLDSSAIVALSTARLRADQPDAAINSFSTVYRVRGMDESRYIDLVSAAYNTRRHTTTPDSRDYLAQLDHITWHQDIPTATPGVYSQNAVMRLAHGNVTVLLDGQGADELFGGYLSYVMAHLNDLRRRDPLKWAPQMAHFAREAWGRFQPWYSARELVSRASGVIRHGRMGAGISSTDMTALAQARRAARATPYLPGADALNQVLYAAVRRDSIPALLHYEDRNSMAHGIEARVPYLDHRLAEFALGVSGDQKIVGAVNKVIMRRALRGTLPDAVVDRRDKLGYPTPFGQWLRTDGALRSEIESYWRDVVMPRGWLDRERAESLWTRHLSGAIDGSAAIHRAITAAMWMHQQEGI